MADVRSLGPQAKQGSELGDKLKSAKTADDVITVLKGAGVEITKAEFLRSQAQQLLSLSDAELEQAHISSRYTTETWGGCITWALGCCP